MNFCPNCGTAKSGNFCGNCGFRFFTREVVAPSATAPNGWYPDPIDITKHRFWDGMVWTEQVRPARADAPSEANQDVSVLEGLLYPEGFNGSKDCENCGEPHSAKASACKLCGQGLQLS